MYKRIPRIALFGSVKGTRNSKKWEILPNEARSRGRGCTTFDVAHFTFLGCNFWRREELD